MFYVRLVNLIEMSAILMTGLLLALRVTAADDQVQDVYDLFRGEWSLQVTPMAALARPSLRRP